MELKIYSIYHPSAGVINDTCKMSEVSYEYVTSVEAENVVRSLYMASGKVNPRYKELGRRDTSIGDIIAHNNRLYMVNGTGGFKRVPSTKPLYRDIMDTDEAIIEILSRKHLTQDDIDELIDNCY